MNDILLKDGYQVKTRWVGDYGSATLWQWSHWFPSLEEAQSYKRDNQNKGVSTGYKLEIEIFRIECV